MDNSSNNKFSAADIERYHAGKMSAEERHALEKAALDDPFLADALEGYRNTSSYEQDLKNLKTAIDQRIARRKHRSPIVRIYLISRIAALIILVVGGGWFLYKFLVPGNKNIAYSKSENAKVDSSVSNVTPKNNTTEIDTISKSSLQKNNKVEDVAVLPNKKKYNYSLKSKGPSSEVPALSEQNKNADSISSLSVAQVKGKERDEVNKVQPSAAFPQLFQPRPKDTNLLTASSITEKKGLAVDTIKNLNVTLKPVNSNLSEVVVTSKMAKKQSVPSMKNQEYVILDTLEPAQGWTNFNDYISSNIKSPEELQIKPNSGDVLLSFDVNNDGDPINIKVVKSLCSKCDEEAIRLLKEGPKWKKKKNKKGKISIHF